MTTDAFDTYVTKENPSRPVIIAIESPTPHEEDFKQAQSYRNIVEYT
jgi:hypothetical protein